MAFLSDGDVRKPVLVAWAPFGAHETIELPRGAALHALDAHGKTVAIEDYVLRITDMPVIVTGFKPGALKTASPKNDVTLRKPGMNLLMNPSFELPDGDAPAFWNPGRFPGGSKDGTAEWASGGRSGVRCLRLGPARDAAWSNVPVPVWTGKTYTARAWVKPADDTGTNTVAIAWYDGTMWGSEGQVTSESVTGAGGWREVTVSGKAPANAVFARIVVSSKDEAGSALWDDVTLTEG